MLVMVNYDTDKIQNVPLNMHMPFCIYSLVIETLLNVWTEQFDQLVLVRVNNTMWYFIRYVVKFVATTE